jgi:Flp pilus assembly protein TadG
MARMTKRSERGAGLAELAVAGMILIGMALFALDIGVAMMTFNLNDRACRDAARAAAQGSDSNEATNLAKQIIKSYPHVGLLATNTQVLGVKYVDFNGNPPANESPYVAVTTRTDCHTIAPVSIFGAEMIKARFPVTKTYVFPIVKLKVANNAAG